MTSMVCPRDAFRLAMVVLAILSLTQGQSVPACEGSASVWVPNECFVLQQNAPYAAGSPNYTAGTSSYWYSSPTNTNGWGVKDLLVDGCPTATCPTSLPVPPPDVAGLQGPLTQSAIAFAGLETILPDGREILSATLSLFRFEGGPAVDVHRMLVPFNSTTTYSTFGASGTQTNGSQAEAAAVGQIAAGASNVWVHVDVLSAVKAWIYDRAPNYGFLLQVSGLGC